MAAATRAGAGSPGGQGTGRQTGPDAGMRADMARLAGVSPSLLFLSEMGREEAVEQKAWEETLW